MDKVPVLTPKALSDCFVLGKILSHGFVLTGYFPLYMSIVCATYLVSGSHSVDDEILLSSFLKFVDICESSALIWETLITWT